MSNIMITDIPGRIILSDSRKVYEFSNSQYCSLPQIEQYLSNVDLLDIWDVYLSGGEILKITQDDLISCIIIPIFNQITFAENGVSQYCYPGESYRFSLSGQGMLKNITDEVATCLVLFFKKSSIESTCNIIRPLEINKIKNQILPIFENISIGCFDYKEKQIQTSTANVQSLYYVIEGSFEIDDRLLGPRDSLILWDKDIVEIESLSNNSILIIYQS